MGISSYLGAMRNIPGLVSVGDALGVNKTSSQLSQGIGVGILAAVFLGWYLQGPMFVALLVVAAGAGLFANYMNAGAHASMVIAGTIIATVFPLLPSATSDNTDVIRTLAELMTQTSGEIREFRVNNARAVAAAMQARNASDAATAGAIGGAVAGIAAGVYTGGNPVAVTAAANAGSGILAAAYKGAGDRAVYAKLDEIRSYFGEYV
jgi:hypothetical protein